MWNSLNYIFFFISLRNGTIGIVILELEIINLFSYI